LGCNGSEVLKCLRNTSVDAVLNAQVKITGPGLFAVGTFWYPRADGYELDEGETVMSALEKQKTRIPLLIGSNLNETSLFQCGSLQANIDANQAKQSVVDLVRNQVTGQNLSPAAAQELMAGYAVGPGAFDSWRSAAIGASTDILFGCPTRHISRVAATTSKVYRYLLGRAPKFFRFDKCLGVPHVSDTFYTFYNNVTGKAMDSGDKIVADAVMGAWYSFAQGEEPELPGKAWPVFEQDKEEFLRIDTDLQVEAGYRSEACKVVDDLVFGYRPLDNDANQILV